VRESSERWRRENVCTATQLALHGSGSQQHKAPPSSGLAHARMQGVLKGRSRPATISTPTKSQNGHPCYGSISIQRRPFHWVYYTSRIIHPHLSKLYFSIVNLQYYKQSMLWLDLQVLPLREQARPFPATGRAPLVRRSILAAQHVTDPEPHNGSSKEAR
jgi:hypothetical protein